jgi:hypothetical protein
MTWPRLSCVPERNPQVIAGPAPRIYAIANALGESGGGGQVRPAGAARNGGSAMTAAAAIALTLCFLGGGCVAAVGAGTVAATDKTPVDHVVSLVSGKDCSIVRPA